MKNFFLIAGFQRSGSTFLYNVLDKHPQISMNKPVRPEPKFFLNSSIDKYDLKKYFEKYFNSDNKDLVLGEKSTSYIEHENSFSNYKKLIPQGKLILILRNPIDRAISNYKFSFENGVEKRSLEEVFIENTPPPSFEKQISVSPFDYVQRGNYIQYIKKLDAFFTSNEVLFICLEDIVEDISRLKKVEKFLDIKPFNWESIDTDKKVNVSNSNFQVSQEVIDQLKDHYLKDIKELQKLTNLQFDNWNI